MKAFRFGADLRVLLGEFKRIVLFLLVVLVENVMQQKMLVVAALGSCAYGADCLG